MTLTKMWALFASFEGEKRVNATSFFFVVFNCSWKLVSASGNVVLCKRKHIEILWGVWFMPFAECYQLQFPVSWP